MFIREVIDMTHLKQHMFQHLRSAKQWLTKAEEAFDQEHDIRGELDLMLAQAELQHVKENNRLGQWRYKYVILRHGVALSLAACVAVAIGGVYWWAQKPEITTVPSAIAGPVVKTVPSAELVVQAEAKPVSMSSSAPQSLPEVTTPSIASDAITQVKQSDSNQAETRRQEQPKQAETTRQSTKQAVVVSPEEMQKLVQAAGKSLRE